MSNSVVTQFRKNQFKETERTIVQLLSDLVSHGYFKMEITGSVIKQGKREVTIEAGKSFRFIIPEKDLPNQNTLSDSCDLSVAYDQNKLP